MGRVFSNGPSKDFVINPFTKLAAEANQIFIAAPYVTRTGDLIQAARSGKRVDLLVGLNAATSPAALAAVQHEPNIRVRYYTHRRFHAKIYLFDTAAMVGSSNLTDGGLQSNREATVLLDDSEGSEAIEELRAVFAELWEYAPVLTDDALKRFTDAHKKFTVADVDELIGGVVGKAEPPNINVGSQKKTAERIFLESLRRQVYEYRNAFNEVRRLLEENKLHRTELDGLDAAHQTNRFLSWIRRTYAPGDVWESAPPRSQDARREEILRLGREWIIPEKDTIHEDYVPSLQRAESTFGEADAIDAASKEDLTQGLTALHAFYEQLRFVKGGAANLPIAFWRENNDDVAKIRKTLKYLVHGGGDFVERLHDVLYDTRLKLRLFGISCALEMYGTVKPKEYPPVNGRIVKGLRYLGFEVQGA